MILDLLHDEYGIFTRKSNDLNHLCLTAVGNAYTTPYVFLWVLKLQMMKSHPTQQGEYESLHRDLNVGFGKWDFDPMDLENPFPDNEGSVHLWMGAEDLIVPVTLQRHIVQQLGWVKYHEVAGAGHLMFNVDGFIDAILRTLLNVKN